MLRFACFVVAVIVSVAVLGDPLPPDDAAVPITPAPRPACPPVVTPVVPVVPQVLAGKAHHSHAKDIKEWELEKVAIESERVIAGLRVKVEMLERVVRDSLRRKPGECGCGDSCQCGRKQPPIVKPPAPPVVVKPPVAPVVVQPPVAAWWNVPGYPDVQFFGTYDPVFNVVVYTEFRYLITDLNCRNPPACFGGSCGR